LQCSHVRVFHPWRAPRARRYFRGATRSGDGCDPTTDLWVPSAHDSRSAGPGARRGMGVGAVLGDPDLELTIRSQPRRRWMVGTTRSRMTLSASAWLSVM